MPRISKRRRKPRPQPPVSELGPVPEIMGYCLKAVESVEPSKESELIDAILSSRRIFIYGSGRSGLIGQLFAVRLVQLGLDVHFVGEMTTPIITKDDLTLLISNTGVTSSVVQTASIAKRIGSKVVSITGVADCDLVEVSDLVILLRFDTNAETKKIAPLGTIFEDSAHMFFEGVVCHLMEKEGISEDEMRGRHAIWV